NEIGAIAVKALSAKPRMGNPTPRICECSSGILNAIGLQNQGAEHFIADDLPWLKSTGAVVIANMVGSSAEDYVRCADILDSSAVDMLEVNISCPNVREGGIAFGTRADTAAALTAEIRRHTKKPLMIKLSPNVSDIAEIARAVEASGADAVSLINTLMGMRINIKTRRPMLANVTGGLSGPAIFPVALRMVWQTRAAIKLPILGGGGITSASDAVEMLLAGADAVSVGTAMFKNPYAPIEIRDGIAAYCAENGISDVSELSGAVRI
ncbi:MAG: dihydroorotate dehydrogenase, partial [Eubacteriales bacterium]